MESVIAVYFYALKQKKNVENKREYTCFMCGRSDRDVLVNLAIIWVFWQFWRKWSWKKKKWEYLCCILYSLMLLYDIHEIYLKNIFKVP